MSDQVHTAPGRAARLAFALLLTFSLGAGSAAGSTTQALVDRVDHAFAVSADGTRIHYAATGSGPLVVMIHGFPDFWLSWRDQMVGLADEFRVVAMDQRGYNLSGQPKEQSAYAMARLVEDVDAVIRHAGYRSATVVGHDWGGAVAWQVAFNLPDIVQRLVILNLPHPRGMGRELAENAEQQANSEYARTFQTKTASDPDVFFGGPMTAERLAGWVSDETARKHYVEAFKRSNFDGMLAYYKQNYGGIGSGQPPPRLAMPVLMFHGLEDQALHSDGLNNTWDWLDSDLTLVTVPGAGHFVQQDAAALVTTTMRWWLLARPPESTANGPGS